MKDRDFLDLQMLARLMSRVSTRNYRCVISGVLEKTGISQSFGAMAFKRAFEKDLDLINKVDFLDKNFVILLIDGTVLGGSIEVLVIGITDQAEKVPLGRREGITERGSQKGDHRKLYGCYRCCYRSASLYCFKRIQVLFKQDSVRSRWPQSTEMCSEKPLG